MIMLLNWQLNTEYITELNLLLNDVYNFSTKTFDVYESLIVWIGELSFFTSQMQYYTFW